MLRIEHRPDAVSALVNRIAGMEADPAEVRVVIETRHGLLVEALVDAGYTERVCSVLSECAALVLQP